MKKRFKLSRSLLLKVTGCGIIGSGIFVADQIRRIKRRVNRAVATDVLSIDRYQPTYIYIEDPYVQEKIDEGNLLHDERVKLTRFHRWLYDKVEESFIFRNWISYRKNYAWRFLRLAQDSEHGYRLRAVKSLAAMHNLSDAEYVQLAQACDLRTAVGLARCNGVNIKFFLDPPYFKQRPDRQAILRHLHDFLLALDVDAQHPCLQYFISKIFTDISETDNKAFDDDLGVSVFHAEHIPMCLEALLHHSWVGNNAKRIVSLGGLPLLMEVYKYLVYDDPGNIDSLIMLSRLMSNISVFDECISDFFMSGWIKILANLSQHSDIRVSAPASRALCNFDKDDPLMKGSHKFHRRIYPLYPSKRTTTQPKIDVIFIHGLLGGVFITWRQRDSGLCGHKSPLELLEKPTFPPSQPGITGTEDYRDSSFLLDKPLDQEFIVHLNDITDWEHIEKSFEIVLPDIPLDSNASASGPFSFDGSSAPRRETEIFSKCWPKDWLSLDCPDIRVIGINYETNISMWTPMCPIVPGKRNLKERSSHLLQSLITAGVGKRPIVWIAHSMGGLLVKDMLVQSFRSLEQENRSIYNQTKAIVFYSTPHKGSHLAALNSTTQMILWPSIEVQELRKDSPALLDLHDSFLDLVRFKPIKVVSFAERESTYITSLKFEIRFVEATSADADTGEMYGIPLDHLCICKPACKQSFLYQRVLRIIKEVLQEVKGQKS